MREYQLNKSRSSFMHHVVKSYYALVTSRHDSDKAVTRQQCNYWNYHTYTVSCF